MSGKDKEQTKTKNNSAPKVTKTSKTDIDKAKDSSQVAPASIDNQPIHTAGGGTVQKVSLDELKKEIEIKKAEEKINHVSETNQTQDGVGENSDTKNNEQADVTQPLVEDVVSEDFLPMTDMSMDEVIAEFSGNGKNLKNKALKASKKGAKLKNNGNKAQEDKTINNLDISATDSLDKDNSQIEQQSEQADNEPVTQDEQTVKDETEGTTGFDELANQDTYVDKISATDAVLHKDELEVTEENGEYQENLDFTKNKTVKKHKLPLPKWAFYTMGGVLALIIIIVSISLWLANRPKEEVVYLSSVKLNVQQIDNNYVGESLDLTGIYFICTYSNGNVEYIYDVENYIELTSVHFDSGKNIVASGDASIGFSYNEKKMNLTVKAYDRAVTEVSRVLIENNTIQAGSTLKYDNILFFVYHGENGIHGERLLTSDEIKNNVRLMINGEVASNIDGFIIPASTSKGTLTITFIYENILYFNLEVTVV